MTLFRFRFPGAPLVFGRWRREAMAAAPRSTAEMLMPLTPGGYYPDFLTPAASRGGLGAGVEAVMSTSKQHLGTQIGLLAADGRPVPSPLRRLAQGDPDTVRRLGEALVAHHRAVVAPYWPQVQAHVDADLAARTRALLDGGSEGLLDSYRPLMRWRYPVLEVDFTVEQDLHLQGRGLLLVPSFFSWSTPDALHNPELPPVLVYPVEHDLRVTNAVPEQRIDTLEALIGATRAWLLEAVGDGCTTSDLAHRVGVAASSVSQHTGVLREARLIHTSRVGKSVLHTLTPLGRSLLEGRLRAEDHTPAPRPWQGPAFAPRQPVVTVREGRPQARAAV
jgi:DNA-binding transcriptional ArsR family regulator